MIPGQGIPSPEELAAGAYPWDAKVKDRVIPSEEVARLTWGGEDSVTELYGLGSNPEMWRASILFFWSRVSTWNGTVEDVWLLMKACEDREILLRQAVSQSPVPTINGMNP